MRALFVPLTGAPTDGAHLETALGVAQVLNAHVSAVFIRPDPQEVFVYTGMMPSVYSGDLEAELSKKIESAGKADAERSRRAFCKALESKGFNKGTPRNAPKRATGSWEQFLGDPAEIVPPLARFSDLVIFSRESKEYKLFRNGLLIETLMHSGRPVLCFPAPTEFRKPKSALIAWNGSSVVTRAIAAALPLIALAETISIAVVGQDVSSEAETGRLESYLEHAHERKSDLIVMGGFGHGRFRETVVGGTSRYLLNHADLPLFLMA